MQIVTQEMLMDEKNKAVRDSYMDRFDVFDKVKALVLLGDTDIATTEMVAKYFELEDKKTIQKVVERHKSELEKDGLRVLSGNELTTYKLNLYRQGVSLSAKRHLTIIPKRAILRIGMLLTESMIAEAIRTHLLNVYEAAPDYVLTDEIKKQFNLPNDEVEALEQLLAEKKKVKQLTQDKALLQEQVDILSPLADAYNRYLNTTGLSDMAIVSKLMGGKWGEYKLFALLRAEGDLFFEGRFNVPKETKMNKKYYKVKRRYSEDGKTSYPVTLITKEGERHILDIVKRFEYLIGDQEVSLHMLKLYGNNKEKFYEDYVAPEIIMELHEKGLAKRF